MDSQAVASDLDSSLDLALDLDLDLDLDAEFRALGIGTEDSYLSDGNSDRNGDTRSVVSLESNLSNLSADTLLREADGLAVATAAARLRAALERVRSRVTMRSLYKWRIATIARRACRVQVQGANGENGGDLGRGDGGEGEGGSNGGASGGGGGVCGSHQYGPRVHALGG